MAFQDDVIANLVREHFRNDARLSDQCLDVEVSERDVVLVGCTSNEELKHLAAEVAGGVPGVRHVQNRVNVKSMVSPQDG